MVESDCSYDKSSSSFTDPHFGLVSWCDDEASWKGRWIVRDGFEIAFRVSVEEKQESFCHSDWAKIRERLLAIGVNDEKIRRQISKKMFKNWKSNWYDEDLDSVSDIDGFTNLIKLSHVTFRESGVPELMYDDGGLYSGHSIIAILDENENLDGAPELFG